MSFQANKTAWFCLWNSFDSIPLRKPTACSESSAMRGSTGARACAKRMPHICNNDPILLYHPMYIISHTSPIDVYDDVVPPPTPTESLLPSPSAYFWGDWDGWWTSSCHAEEPQEGTPYLHEGVQGAAKGWARGFHRWCSQRGTCCCKPGSCYGVGDFRWGRWYRAIGRLDSHVTMYIDLEARVTMSWQK